MSSTIVLKGLIQRYLALTNHIVIPGDRDPTHENSKGLTNLPKGE